MEWRNLLIGIDSEEELRNVFLCHIKTSTFMRPAVVKVVHNACQCQHRRYLVPRRADLFIAILELCIKSRAGSE